MTRLVGEKKEIRGKDGVNIPWPLSVRRHVSKLTVLLKARSRHVCKQLQAGQLRLQETGVLMWGGGALCL